MPCARSSTPSTSGCTSTGATCSPTPSSRRRIISLAAGNDVAGASSSTSHERGAKIFLIRVAPVPTWKGRRSFALPEFDPFWERVQELDVVVGMHSGDPGYQRYINEWEGLGDQEFSILGKGRRASPAFVALSSEKDNLVDAMASIIGHGLATRFPQLRFLPVEYSSRWIRPFYEKLQRTYEATPVLFDEDPVAVFNRSVWVHAFHEPDPEGPARRGHPGRPRDVRLRLPAPRGHGRPVGVRRGGGRPAAEQQALIMGGSLEQAMKVGTFA